MYGALIIWLVIMVPVSALLTGLGTALVSYAVSRPVYQGLRGILLTKNAHGLYRKFGFELNTERAMIK